MASDNQTFYFKELNAIAIILIILCQVGQNFPTNLNTCLYIIPLSYIDIGTIGFPLIFMTTGALLLNRECSISAFLKKHLLPIAVATLFWTVISVAVYGSYTRYSMYFFTTWTLNSSFLWFPLALIGVYIMIPVFNSFIREYGFRGCECFLVIWLLLFIVNCLGLIDNTNIIYVFDNIGIYIGYAVLGYYLANRDFKILSGPMIVFAAITFTASLSLTLHLINTYAISMNLLSFAIMIDSSALFLIFRYVERYSHFKPGRRISKIHNYIKSSSVENIVNIITLSSFGMYFISNIIIKFIAKKYIVTAFDALPSIFIITTLISLAAMILLSFVPFLNRIIGIK